MVRAQLTNFFIFLGEGEQHSAVFADVIVRICQKAASVEEMEKEMGKFCTDEAITDKFGQVVHERPARICRHIIPHLAGERVLEIGSWNKMVGHGIVAMTGKHVEGTVYSEGAILPHGTKSFDTTVCIAMLHHVNDPAKLLSEAARVSSRRIIVIETINSPQENQQMVPTFMDWFYNSILHGLTNLPYNYRSPQEWEQLFAQNGLKVALSKDMGVDNPLIPVHHWLYVLER